MTPEKPPEITATSDYLYWWLSPILLLVVIAFCWSNHFDSGFHRDDFPNIVENRHIRNGDTRTLITSPAAFSKDSGLADYRPLLALLFVFDNSIRQDGQPSIFQLTSFVWFLPLPFLIYGLVRLMPEAKHQTALLSAMLFAVHPIASDTLNYISKRGELIAAGAVMSAMFLWIYWPQRLPATLGIDLYHIPKTKVQEFLFKHGAMLEALYKRIRTSQDWFFYPPLVVGLLCSPATAAFAAVGAAWLWVYPNNGNPAKSNTVPQRTWRRLFGAIGLCVFWLILHTVVTWKYVAPQRAPALQYWLGQPLVTVQYFIWFFTPFNMSADAGLLPQLRFWPPDILLGIAGTVALATLAIFARRRDQWRPVAFGIAWFLAAQLPFVLVPQTSADSGARMFIPTIGLAIAVGHILIRAVEYLQQVPRYAGAAAFSFSMALFFLLCAMGWLTFERNKAWVDDRSLWADTVRRSPGNQRALVGYAWELVRFEDLGVAVELARRADLAAPQDAPSEVSVADVLDRLGADQRAEFHYTRAVALWPNYASAMSAYGKWLLARQRYAEATDWSVKAIRLNSRDNVARGNLMEMHSAAFEWESVRRVAVEALEVDPDNAQAKLALVVSEDALNRVARAEHRVDGEATFNDYLTLSVAYFRARKYEECITAARQAITVKQDLAEAHANISACQHALGRDDEAIAELREVIRLRPDMAVAHSNLAFLEQDRLKKRTQIK